MKAGCNLLRFTFPQQPKSITTEIGVIPSQKEKDYYKKDLEKLKTRYKNSECSILIVDADNDYNIHNKPRTIPCFARYVFPTIGFDGWLYNCSQSSAPNFRLSALGDLKINNFWDLYYNYKVEKFNDYLISCSENINDTGCRCDRKEHVLNQQIIDGKIF
jgi:hypothetical protein